MGKRLSPKQLVFLRVMSTSGVSFRKSNTVTLTTWFAGEFALRYRDGKALSDAGLVAYSGSKVLEPYCEAWHVTDAGRALLEEV